MIDISEVAGKYREKWEEKSYQAIELQMLCPRHKTPKIKKKKTKNYCDAGKHWKRKGSWEIFLWEWKEAAFLFEKRMKVKPLGNSDWWFSFMNQPALNTFPLRSGITISFYFMFKVTKMLQK